MLVGLVDLESMVSCSPVFVQHPTYVLAREEPVVPAAEAYNCPCCPFGQHNITVYSTI